MASLHLLDGTNIIYLTVPGIYTLGRDPACDFLIDHASVSGQHAILTYQPTFLTISDQNSTNGIRVNYTDVDRQTLMDGDVLEIGNVSYNVRGPELRAQEILEAVNSSEQRNSSPPSTVSDTQRDIDGESEKRSEILKQEAHPLLFSLEAWKGSLVTFLLLLLGALLLFIRLGSVGGTP